MSNDVILIVDDSKFIVQAYSRVLLGLGYRVLIACDGKTGLFAAESCNPSIILLDMHDMDDVEVLRKLKQTPSTSDIPVLAISSLSEQNSQKLIQEGAAGYFEKGTMTPEKLENAVSGILEGAAGYFEKGTMTPEKLENAVSEILKKRLFGF